MPITEKEIPEFLEFIGLKDAKDINELKANFKNQWHTAESFFDSKEFTDYVGRTNGSLFSKLKGVGKIFGVSFEGKETEGKKIEELIELGFSKLQAANNEAIESEKAKGKGGKDERFTTLETTFNNMKRDYETLEGTNKKLKEDWDTEKQGFASALKNEKLSFRTKDLFSTFKWSKEANDLTKKGFMASISEKAKFDLDENDNLVVLDAKTGKKFDNPGKHAAFLSPDEFLTKEGVEAKVYQVNNDGGKPAGQGWGSGFNQNQNPNESGNSQAPAKRNDLAITQYQ